MPAWLTPALLADIVIAVTLLEGSGLLLWRWRTGRGLRAAVILRLLAPGLCLMAALRLAVSGAPTAAVALCLALAGGLHVLDMSRRWPRD